MTTKAGYDRGYFAGIRRAVVTLLGDKCEECGERDIRVLEIDHTLSDGAAHRKAVSKSRGTTWKVLLSVVEALRVPGGRQWFLLLCANCHARVTSIRREAR